MAVAVAPAVTTEEHVIAAVLQAHAARGERAVEQSTIDLTDSGLPSATEFARVVAPERRTVEYVLDEGTDPAAISGDVWRLAANGWHVLVLVASDRLGSAHRALRGTPCRVQQWWFEGDRVWFGALEIP